MQELLFSRKTQFHLLEKKISDIGIETETAWGLIVCNHAYTAEFNWWIMNTTLGMIYTPIQLSSMLSETVTSENSRTHIVTAYKNIFSSNDILGKALGLRRMSIERK